MRTPATVVRGVSVIVIILGVVFISNISMVQSGADQLLLEETTPSPTPTATPNTLYYPVMTNKYGFLYSSVVNVSGQGFDHCYPLSVEGMQDWWDHSPYSSVNIYLGGISALCPFDALDIDWFTRVAEQGWTFILTWAGPQAPIDCPEDCKFRHPMSMYPAIAYIEGRLEALAAVETAEDMGFKGQLVIYYDVESYSGADEETRAAVAAFIDGWTEQLHELDHIAGAYGAACTSYVVDWAFNDPPVDNVWIAQWNKVYEYDLGASVYDTTCVDTPGQPPIFWTNHQRIKQYTGPHNETHGTFTSKIDSDVLDGQVVALFGQPPGKKNQTLQVTNAAAPIETLSGSSIGEIQLLSPSTGWVLTEDRLLWTNDGGYSWQDVNPNSTERSEILGVHFFDTHLGWAAIRRVNGEGVQSLVISQTQDSGQTWTETQLDDFSSSEVLELESASFEFLDGEIGWLALKLHSGINFSFGRLLATLDGGHSWQEKSLPLGEPVIFADEYNGLTAGGPLNQVYSTNDGGTSWSLSENINFEQVKMLSSEVDQFDSRQIPQDAILLKSFSSQVAWAVVQGGACTGYKMRPGEQLPAGEQPLQCEISYNLVKTSDGGLSWTEIRLPD